MAAGTDWLRENLGIIEPETVPRAGGEPGGPERDLAREIIDFDSEDTHSEARAFFARAPKAHGLANFKPILWPKGLAPTPIAPPTGDGLPLPKSDVLVVTWTVDEGHAL